MLLELSTLDPQLFGSLKPEGQLTRLRPEFRRESITAREGSAISYTGTIATACSHSIIKSVPAELGVLECVNSTVTS
jgi:hypothetical protein